MEGGIFPCPFEKKEALGVVVGTFRGWFGSWRRHHLFLHLTILMVFMLGETHWSHNFEGVYLRCFFHFSHCGAWIIGSPTDGIYTTKININKTFLVGWSGAILGVYIYLYICQFYKCETQIRLLLGIHTTKININIAFLVGCWGSFFVMHAF